MLAICQAFSEFRHLSVSLRDSDCLQQPIQTNWFGKREWQLLMTLFQSLVEMATNRPTSVYEEPLISGSYDISHASSALSQWEGGGERVRGLFQTDCAWEKHVEQWVGWGREWKRHWEWGLYTRCCLASEYLKLFYPLGNIPSLIITWLSSCFPWSVWPKTGLAGSLEHHSVSLI